MTKPNSPEETKNNVRKSYWPVWFPYPSSWLKSFILALFFRVITFVVQNTGKIGFQIANFANSPELLVIFFVIATLSPILVITFTHHLVHLFIGRFFPRLQAPEMNKIQGILPRIISYWEGLYGWLVTVISSLIAIMVTTISLPLFNLSYENPVESYNEFEQNVILIFGCTWISMGAVIYQIEFLFKRRLIAVYSVNITEQKSQENINNGIDREMNLLKGEMGMHNMQGNVQPYEKEVVSTNKQKYSFFSKKRIAIFSLIPLVAIGILLFSNLLNVQQNNQFIPMASQPQLPSNTETLTPDISPQSDNFREAVNQAINAANLTQLAKSQNDWKTVANEWQKSIDMMKSVPVSSPNYAVAQKKILEYQQNINYAQKNTNSSK
ncbi:hypothetical protein [Anabaena lutea]|uniref:Uncharacterized protein n=1 Tax=Anabaena lutea FACHB-196 TaxID=2692881 RepID=A0ABR8FGI3_9NOST|nr:hypothetical protein [Anabaena lutea]MBD2569179.1 hypothetical protein [Anabaena lutea FACHB-196]